MASSARTQGTEHDAQISLERFHPGSMEDCSTQKRLCSTFQESIRYVSWSNHVLMVEYAAAFFMLADQPKDAISVCLRQMGDWQLAVALAKAIEPDSNGPLLKWILTDRVVPMAFEGGHRWLASWAFWTLGRRDLSVRVLIVSDVCILCASPDI